MFDFLFDSLNFLFVGIESIITQVNIIFKLEELQKENSRLEKDIKEREETYQAESVKSFECVICFEKLRRILLLPCKHLSVCKSCFDLGVKRNDE